MLSEDKLSAMRWAIRCGETQWGQMQNLPSKNLGFCKGDTMCTQSWKIRQDVTTAIRKIKDYSLKTKEILTHAIMWVNLEDIKWNKPVTKRQILSDSTYTMYLEQSDSSRQKVERWLPVREGKIGGWHWIDIELQFCKIKKLWRLGAQ